MINLIAVGDVVAQKGCEFLRRKLPELKKAYNADITIVNGENSAQGNGIIPTSAEHILDSGADVITTGNHVFKRREIYRYLDEHANVLRPLNYPSSAPGKGYFIFDMGRIRICVASLMGTVYLESLENPFTAADKLIRNLKDDADMFVFDFHAEATGEKAALAHYLSGRASLVFGTHTHVQTADESILNGHTGFITDIGMTGASQSALGIKPESVIQKFLTCMPVRFEYSDNPPMLNGIAAQLDEASGRCVKIERINIF